MSSESSNPAAPSEASTKCGGGGRILIVDDLPANLNVLSDALEMAGYEVVAAPSGDVALKVAGKARPDLILLDVMMPGMDGYAVCRGLKSDANTREIPVVFLTAKDETHHILQAFRAGGVDYILKPFQVEEVLARVGTHLSVHRLTRELRQKNEELQAEIKNRERIEARLQSADERLSFITEMEARRWGLAGFIGSSATFGKIIKDLRQLQNFNTTVLIFGESGTGKELIARALHYGGRDASGPFVPVNCSAIPAELLESSFFGHIKGAFTGAISDRKGFFEQSDGGTLFLDEIGDMPLALQAKLLRVLEDGTVTPVGAVQSRPFRARVVAATNASLPSVIASGQFRKDLYYRLARFTIEVPPLRERAEDIVPLARHFLSLFAAEMGCRQPELTPAAAALLENYDFPGNIRELKNMVERALIVCEGVDISPEHLDLERLFDPPNPVPTSESDAAAIQTRKDRGQAAEARVLAFIRQQGAINNAQCRELLGLDLHQASYFLRKMQRAGKLLRDQARRWAQYRLP